MSDSFCGFIAGGNHCFKLALIDIFMERRTFMEQVHANIKKLNGPVSRATLHKHTDFSPIVSNTTRWSSEFGMLKRSTEIWDIFSVWKFQSSMIWHSIAEKSIDSYILCPNDVTGQHYRVLTMCWNLFITSKCFIWHCSFTFSSNPILSDEKASVVECPHRKSVLIKLWNWKTEGLET